MNLLGMSITNSHIENPKIEEQIKIFADAGFDSFFLSFGVTENFEKIPEWASLAADCGIDFEAVHAPTIGVNSMWIPAESDERQAYLESVHHVIDMCSAGGVPKLVLHTAYGNPPPVSNAGLYNFSELEKYAEGQGVHLCYENGDVAEHLVAVLKNAGEYHGFCLDAGHNLCYARDINFAELFGDKIVYTHLHDNMGKSDEHLLPYDGIRNWDDLMHTLRAKNYGGTLNLELSCRGLDYNSMTYVDFVEKARRRLDKLKNMM